MRNYYKNLTEIFSDFSEFLERTAGYDRQFLNIEEQYKLPIVMCAMANSVGGWIIFGAEEEKTDEKIIVTGLNDTEIKIPEKNIFSEEIDFEFFEINNPEKILVIKVNPLIWYKRPVILSEKFVYRRVEGENLISGKRSKIQIANDSMNFSSDDFPIRDNNKTLNIKNVLEFKEILLSRNSEISRFEKDEFLKRSFIYSGKFLSNAGFLTFGENSVLIEIKLYYKEDIIKFESHNLWQAYFNMLPRLTRYLSDDCSKALKEMFINSIIHNDYNINNFISIKIKGGPARVIIKNFGIPRTFKDGESIFRNFRLMKIFKMIGVVNGCGSGINIIKKYQDNFKPEYNMLDFSFTASINLKPRINLPGPVIL